MANEYIAICDKETGRLIGDLFATSEGDTVSVGWHLNPVYGGNGFALEAAVLLLRSLFKNEGVRRVYAYVEDDNVRSQRLCRRLGMREEGLF